MKKKRWTIGLLCVVAILAAYGAWSKWFSPTRIAFVNYQVTELGQIAKANDNQFIRIEELPVEEIEKGIGKYDMAFINGMGIRITEAQRKAVQERADAGMPILVTAATNPANNIMSLDSTDYDNIMMYLTNGGRGNYRNMLSYVRREIDGKAVKAPRPGDPVEKRYYMLYHPDIDQPENEDMGFSSVAAYEEYLRSHGLYGEEKPRVVITGQMGDPTDLIRRLEETGNVVYPVRFARTFFRGEYVDSVRPSAVINMAHGRMGDYMVELLTERNIPLFAPLNVNRLAEEWENDPMGMSGGFMSQSIVTPEIDGALRPMVLFGNYTGEDGLQYLHAIPERLDVFVETVNNYISLQEKPNAEKRVVIYYFKGPGQNALTAGGMEVVPSLYNLLARMREEGYNVTGLPSSAEELGRMIQERGAVFGGYAEGAQAEFLTKADPEIVTKSQYEAWAQQSLGEEMYREAVEKNGEFPGGYMAVNDSCLGLARLKFGNVVLMPQLAAGSGSNDFEVVHGTNAAPPHAYIAEYLWAQHGFKADAMIHFGAHGSLEFTPKKQVALSRRDWPDRLVGTVPHLYIYTIGNVGEAMMAKRRAYAGIHSYLTPPFMESGVRNQYKELTERLKRYDDIAAADVPDSSALRRVSVEVKRVAVEMGMHRDLGLDSTAGTPYSEEEIVRIENFAEELANEKITGAMYVMGEPYDEGHIQSTVMAMSTDPVAYSVYALDKLRGRASADMEKRKAAFTRKYITPAKRLVESLLNGRETADDETVCRVAGITQEELAETREVYRTAYGRGDMMSMMMGMAEEMPVQAAVGSRQMSLKKKPEGADMHAMMKKMGKGMSREEMLKMAKKMGADEEALKRMEAAMTKGSGDSSNAEKTQGGMPQAMKAMMGMKREYTADEKEFALAVNEIERAVKNVERYREALLESPEAELASVMNGLAGGYTVPSPGGDPVANPNVLPTGRNLFAINAEATPSEAAWEKGKRLAENTIEMYRRRHNDSIPRKVSYTLWSSEFIETEGATIAQILYMLGVEPIRDAFGRVTDLRLIPSAELGRPRIDVVVQTSGQLRDIAASRLFLIQRAVGMAAEAKDAEFENQVAAGVVETERVLVEKGMTPKEAREVSRYRVFGGVNGGYGTGIQGMVQAGDRWESEKEIADVYMNNMGAYYGSEKNWEEVRQSAFEAALTRTDAVIQPRQSNTWGALSLDHVYEFMGGMNLAVRNVTGKDPDAYLSDYRNRNNVRMQEVKEAMGVESRTTIFNPNYIREKMKGDAGDAAAIDEIIQNTYGWNVMKPQAIDDEMWDKIYDVYIKDAYGLGVQQFFEEKNPAAMQDMTAVMMETARKGLWDATEEQLAAIAELHTGLVNKYKPACSGMVCDNVKLRDFISSKTADAASAAQYSANIRDVREAVIDNADKGMVMKREQLSTENSVKTNTLSNTIIAVVAIAVLVCLGVFVHHRRKNME